MTDTIPTPAAVVPADLVDLLERPLFGILGTVRPDAKVQVNPMWFEYDGEHIRFTHTTKRAKFRNLQRNPSMSLAVLDPEDPMRYLEIRGRLVEAVPDPSGAFYVVLGKRYGNAAQQPPADSADRVILVMSIEKVGRH
jgi:PPOX class probable F420-dependent enzyme